MSKLRERHSLCFHEAGHAVAALHVGAIVDSVSVEKRPDSDGRTMVMYRKNGGTRRTMQEAIINVAGPAADGMFASDCDRARVRASLVAAAGSQDFPDYSEHRTAIRHLYAKQRQPGHCPVERLSEMAIDQALKIIEQRWSAIEEIACELNCYGKLSGEVVKMLYHKAEWAGSLVAAISVRSVVAAARR